MLNHLLDRQFDLSNNVVGTVTVRVPEFNREILICLDQFRSDQKSGGFLPDRIEVISDDSCAVHWFAIFGEGQCDVRVASTPFAATLVLLAQTDGAVDANPHDTQSLNVLGDVVSLKHGSHVKGHALWSNVQAGSGTNGVLNEVGDERQVENVGGFLEHWNTSRLDMRHSHQSERKSLQEWWFRCHVHPQTNSSNQLLQLDKDGQRNTKEAFDTEVEDKSHVHIPCLVIGALSSRSRVVGEGDLEIVVVTSLFVRSSFLRVLGLLVLIVDGVLHFFHVRIRKSAQAENADRVAALVDLCNTDVLDYTRNGSLHDIFKGVSDTLEHVGIDEAPDDGHEGIHPFDGLGEEVCSSLGRSVIIDLQNSRCTYGFSTLFFAAPFDLSSASNDLFGP